LVQKESNAQVLAISIAFSPDREKHAIQIALPLGIDLRRGADIHVSNVQAKGVRITRCELSGCIIEAILAPDMLEAMRSTEKGAITVSANGKTDTKIEFSLKGFLEADEALKSETIARMP
jgi:invasion protein IalB